MNRTLKLAAVIGLMATGCLGPGYEPPVEGDPPVVEPVGPGPAPSVQPPVNNPTTTPTPPVVPAKASSARNQFESGGIFAILSSTDTTKGCAGATCHDASQAPKFVGTAATAYDTILVYAADPLLSNFDSAAARIFSKTAGGAHYGLRNEADRAAVKTWIDAEKAARAGGPAAVSKRLVAMAEWSGCMKLADFTQVAQTWGNKQTNNTPCKNCHVQGQGWLADASGNQNNQAAVQATTKRVFDILTTQAHPYGGMFMEYYFVPDMTDPNKPVMKINTVGIQRAASGFGQHDRFNVDGQAMQALQAFYDKTLAAQTAKTCDPPRFKVEGM